MSLSKDDATTLARAIAEETARQTPAGRLDAGKRDLNAALLGQHDRHRQRERAIAARLGLFRSTTAAEDAAEAAAAAAEGRYAEAKARRAEAEANLAALNGGAAA